MKKNNDFINHNIKNYDHKYLNLNYGINYPEGHVVRHARYFRNKKSILDFGCGNGTHLKFFSDIGIKKIYGVDTSEVVNKIKNKKFKTFKIGAQENLVKKFRCKFDVIISNQVLYYLSDKSLSFYFEQFNKLLKKNGLIFTTWMSPKSGYYKISKKIKNSEFRELKLKSSKDKTFINFKKIKDIEKIIKKNNFKTLHYGHYDKIMSYKELDNSSFHYLNLSIKK